MIPAIAQNERGVACLTVDGRPFPILGGELHNSASSDLAFMREHVWPSLRGLNVNTVLAPIAWESLEPREGAFDFTLMQGLLDQARQQGVRLVPLWFGLWKNGESFYAPEWVKLDRARFFRARQMGGAQSDTISPLCEQAVAADRRAFCRLMEYLREHDEAHTVIMVQVENEIGFLGSDRDHSEPAERAFSQPIPPELETVLHARGRWAEALGDEAGEAFMAWHYARAVQAIASAGREILPLPMYCNAWIEQHPERAGTYPSGGAVARMIPIWRAAAPALSMVSPDIYVRNFKLECARYARRDNPLFIPEAAHDAEAASRALYAFGEHHALGFSPFGIEDMQAAPLETPGEETLKKLNIPPEVFRGEHAAVALRVAYAHLEGIYPRLAAGDCRGYLRAHPYENGCMIKRAGYDIRLDYLEGTCGSGGLMLFTDDGLYVIGCNTRMHLLPKLGRRAAVELLRYEDGAFAGGAWRAGRVMNGDERYELTLGDLPCARFMRIHVTEL